MDLRERWQDVYRDRRDAVRRLVRDYPEERSLSVDLVDLHDRDPQLAEALFSDPDRVLRRGAETLADLHEELDRVNLRVENHPGLLAADAVRARHVGELVTVEGVVAERGPVGARLGEGAYACRDCEHEHRRYVSGVEARTPGDCPACGGELSLRRSASRFVDVRRLGVRGADGGLLDVYVDDDLVGVAAPEDRVFATGVVRLDRREGTGLFDFYLDALSVEVGHRQTRGDGDDEVRDLIESRWEVMG